MESTLTLILIVFMIGYLVYASFSKKTKLFDTAYIREDRAPLFLKIGRACFLTAAVLSLHLAMTALYSITDGGFPRNFDLVPEWITRVVIIANAVLVLTPFVLAILFTDKKKFMERQKRERGMISEDEKAEIFADSDTIHDDGSAADPFGDGKSKTGGDESKG